MQYSLNMYLIGFFASKYLRISLIVSLTGHLASVRQKGNIVRPAIGIFLVVFE